MEIFKLFGSIFVDNDEANKSISDTDKKGQGLGGMFGKIGSAAIKFGTIAAAAVGTVAIALGTKAVFAADELKRSLNGLQASTGVSADMMDDMRDSMLEIYKNNFGESFEDIGKAMALVKQQTGLSGDALKDMTTNAIMMRDTFEFDVNESLRAADMLVEQFGISGEEAYNLIAQGAQWGLDKNGDLLDSINEYSVHFQQMGFDSEEMFNMLVNGASSGTFSVDKLGDAVKEFGIRSKDGSKASSEAFAILGLDAQAMTSQFAQGGEVANLAFETVTQKLLAMKDPVAQNAAGVGLFGTQFEDLGVKGIEALVSTQGEITNTHNALKAINEVKYDTFGEAIKGIGRQFEVGVLIPLGEKILPILNDFADWFNENMPLIQAVGKNAFDKVSEAIEKNREKIEIIKVKFGDFFKSVTEFFKSFMIFVKAFWDLFGEDILRVLGVIFSLTVAAFQNLFNTIKNVLDIFSALFKGDWSALWQAVQNLVKDSFEGSKRIIGLMLELIVGQIEAAKSFFVEAGKAIMNGLWDGIKAIWENIQTWVNSKVSWLSEKLKFWEKSQTKMAAGGSGGTSSSGFVNGSHANGLSYVPFDGYVAELHKGERVLTAAENKSSGSGITVMVTGNTIMNDRDADRIGDLIIGRLRGLGIA